MKYRLCIFLVLILTVSCKKKYKVLPKAEMVQILTDIHKLESVVSQSKVSYTSPNSPVPGYYQYILEKYGTTRDDFEHSIIYYTNKDTAMYGIYNKVINNMLDFQKEATSGRMYNLSHEELGLPTTLKITTARLRAIVPTFQLDTSKLKIKNLLTQKSIYRIPENGAQNKIDFELNSNIIGDANDILLSFTAKLYPNDSSINPQSIFIAEYQSSNDTLMIDLEKSGNWKVYSIKYNVRSNEKIKKIRGKLFEHDNSDDNNHAIFWNFLIYKIK